MIALCAVHKAYDGKRALGPLSLRVERGAALAIVGPSGCGKSTLLRAMLGLVRIDGGSVTIGGARLPGDVRAVRRRVGYVVQDGGLFPHLTVEGNAGVVARHLGWDEERIGARIEELRVLVGLDPDVLARFPLQLSGGQRQRVGLMRALMLDPDVLLMDEPLGALDPITRSKLQRELRAIFRALRKTVVVVTHDVREAAYLGDEAIVMRDGNIVQRGTIAEMMRSPADSLVAELLATAEPGAGA